MKKKIILKTPAKINLGLNILKKRNDNFHELQSLILSINLFDYLYFEILFYNKIIIKSNNNKFNFNNKNHILYKTIKLLKEKYKIKKGIKIFIKKKIPVFSGLGGISSDCACILKTLNILWNLKLNKIKLLKIASKLGTDISYFILNKPAIVFGRGEKIKIIKLNFFFWIILIKLINIKISTKKIFKKFKLKLNILHPNIFKLKKAVINNKFDDIILNMGNSLENLVLKEYIFIKKIKNYMFEAGAENSIITGSGSAVFSLCRNKIKAKKILNNLKKKIKHVYMFRTLL